MTSAGNERPRNSLPLTILADVVAPIAIFYVLRAFGVGQVPALLAGAAAPALHAVYTVVRQRRVDAVALFTLSIILLTVISSGLTGDARFVLAKDGVITAVAGLWILATLMMSRPFIYQFSTALQGAEERASWGHTWERSTRFRRGMAVLTVIWGVGLLLDAVVRVVMAYTLPVDSVPLLNGIQYALLFVLLFLVSAVYGRIANLRPGSPDWPEKAPKAARRS